MSVAPRDDGGFLIDVATPGYGIEASPGLRAIFDRCIAATANRAGLARNGPRSV
jgi:hypothetical protein